jgi:hypothetical protein
MVNLNVAKESAKQIAAQKRATTLWEKYLKDHIVGLIASTQGQHRDALKRVKKAMRKDNLDAVKKEFLQLKKGKGEKRKKGFLIPIFVEREITSKKAEKYPLRQAKVGKKIYLAPDSKLSKKLQKAWEEFQRITEGLPTD